MNNINKIAHLTIDLARKIYGNDFIPLHRPIFEGNEKKYLLDCIDSNFVSSVGKKVNEFEDMVCNFTGAKYAVATFCKKSLLAYYLIKLSYPRDF